jgi:hypothetical protein
MPDVFLLEQIAASGRAVGGKKDLAAGLQEEPPAFDRPVEIGDIGSKDGHAENAEHGVAHDADLVIDD